MKLTTFTTTLLTTALATTARALPTTPSASNPLTKRAAYCTSNSIQDTTTPNSALVSDCEVLSTSVLPSAVPEPWTPTESNNHTLDLTHNTCGLRAHFLGPPNGTLDASQVVLSAGQLANLIDVSVARYGTNEEGTVGAEGMVICLQAGMVTKVGWVDFEVYRV